MQSWDEVILIDVRRSDETVQFMVGRAVVAELCCDDSAEAT